MPYSKVRVVGSGFSTFNYQGKPIAWLTDVRDSGQAVYSDQGQGVESIYVIGSRHAEEIVTSRVLATGTLTASIKELWNANIWEQLQGLAGTNDLAAVYDRLAAEPTEVTCQILIRPPGQTQYRGKTYHNCVPTSIGDGETITVGGLSVTKAISIMYTHTTPVNG